jgi:photosystem II stability/assembly factor-like uncharacterized protein
MRRIWIVACIAMALACLGALTAPIARAFAPDGSQGWYWQMPQPAGTLYDVTFASPSEVWAVGPGGTILHSADAGLSWSAQQSGTFADLDSASFPDAQHGWVCGGVSGTASVLLATSDGGTTWDAQTPAGLKGDLASVSFVDDQHGWLGTDDGHVLRTTNGGLTWTTSRLEKDFVQFQVDFVDGLHGWAQGDDGKLWHTSNGGASWTLVHLFAGSAIELMGVDFTSSSHGWAYLFSEPTNASTILSTSDGGRVWHTVRRINQQMVADLHATSSSTACFVSDVGSPNAPLLAESGETSLWRTTNGGVTWSSQRVGSMVEPWAVGGFGASYCAVGQGIVSSSDEGPWLAASSGQNYTLQDGVAVSGSDLWAVDQAGAVLHSSDGGRWTEQSDPKRWSLSLSGVSFPDADDGWVVGGGAEPFFGPGVILHTSDGGTSWTPQSSVLGSLLAGVDFTDDTTGWAISQEPFGFGAGANTAVEHTTDGGAHWVAQYVPNNPGLTSASFISDTTGWVGGDYQVQSGNTSVDVPLIAKTTDGGSTWTAETLPKGSADPSGLQFLDANQGWAVGTSDNGVSSLLHSTNGGSSWARVDSLPTSVSTDSVHFFDAQHGWVGGAGVWATTDGGTTWAQVAGESGVNAITATDTNHAWAFGDGIISTVDSGGVDSAPPQTLDNADWGWHRSAVIITLSPNDTSGSGLAGTQFSSDGGTTWQSGTSIAVAAPISHANDGLHSFLYRSSDNAGNAEATEICGVGIDTLGPTCAAPKEAVADVGKPVVIRFKANDATSGVSRATITIVSRTGHVLRTLVTHSGNWSYGPPDVPYYWLRFTCKLKPGHYRIEVRATDRAGNAQVRMGINVLRVVRRGAPLATHPQWPAGLPDTTQQFGTAAAGALSSRATGPLGRTLKAKGLSERLMR